jgi:hypothetical protein
MLSNDRADHSWSFAINTNGGVEGLVLSGIYFLVGANPREPDDASRAAGGSRAWYAGLVQNLLISAKRCVRCGYRA